MIGDVACVQLYVTQPCLHTLMQTRLSANRWERVYYLSCFINKLYATRTSENRGQRELYDNSVIEISSRRMLSCWSVYCIVEKIIANCTTRLYFVIRFVQLVSQCFSPLPFALQFGEQWFLWWLFLQLALLRISVVKLLEEKWTTLFMIVLLRSSFSWHIRFFHFIWILSIRRRQTRQWITASRHKNSVGSGWA